MSSLSPPLSGPVCEWCGRKFPHLGYQPAPGLTKWFCNETCKRKWLKGEAAKAMPPKAHMGKLP